MPLPLFPVVVSQMRRVLPPQGEDGRPHIAGVPGEFFCDTGKGVYISTAKNSGNVLPDLNIRSHCAVIFSEYSKVCIKNICN